MHLTAVPLAAGDAERWLAPTDIARTIQSDALPRSIHPPPIPGSHNEIAELG